MAQRYLVRLGAKVGRWTVLRRVESNRHGQAMFLCRCECGIEKIVAEFALRRGASLSCGCLRIERIKQANTTHGETRPGRQMEGKARISRTYAAWCNMKARCTNLNNKAYRYYGGRGIKVCDRWMTSFDNFLEDMGECPEEYQIDRKDPSGDYALENCRWATRDTQLRSHKISSKWLQGRV